MNNGTIIIFDSEAEYALKLAEYFNLKSGLNYSVSVFTDYHSLKNYLSENNVDILLISEKFCQYMDDLKDIPNIFILTEGNVDQVLQEYASLYKYQPTDCILRDVMTCYAADCPETSSKIPTALPAKITGVYSPVRRCGKTSFSLAYGCILSLSKKCLYINLEEYSGFSYFVQDLFIGDFSDLIYFYRQNPANIDKKLTALSRSYHNLDYIPPMHFGCDIRNMEIQDLVSFVQAVSKTRLYEEIILDISDSVSDVPSLLSICDHIYMPSTKDSISNLKIEEAWANYESAGQVSIRDKTEILILPYADQNIFSDQSITDYNSSVFMEKLLFSEFGVYIRNLISQIPK